MDRMLRIDAKSLDDMMAEIKQLTAERDKLKAALSECLTVIRPLSIRLTEEQKKLVPNMNAAHNLAYKALKESA